MIILGIFVFQMVAGDDETSIKSGISKAWEHEITERVNVPFGHLRAVSLPWDWA